MGSSILINIYTVRVQFVHFTLLRDTVQYFFFATFQRTFCHRKRLALVFVAQSKFKTSHIKNTKTFFISRVSSSNGKLLTGSVRAEYSTLLPSPIRFPLSPVTISSFPFSFTRPKSQFLFFLSRITILYSPISLPFPFPLSP
jgi:hypothetical protein